MGEFTDEPGPAVYAPEEEEKPTSYDTDVEGVTSSSVVNHKGADYPNFSVDKDSFHQNMQDGRRRLRFKSGTDAQKYMAGTKYKRAFYINYTDDNGTNYQRKIK